MFAGLDVRVRAFDERRLEGESPFVLVDAMFIQSRQESQVRNLQQISDLTSRFGEATEKGVKTMKLHTLVVITIGSWVANAAWAATPNDGYIDGIYRCTVALEGRNSEAYLSLNGRRDGKTVYLVAADVPARDGFSGYGLGLLSGNKFSGNTSFGKRFEFFIVPQDETALSLRGTVGVVGLSGRAANARLDCLSIW